MKKLYLDDIRTPPDSTWIKVESYEEFIAYIQIEGLPDIISFDHDLGYGTEEEKTGYDCAKWLINYILDNNINQKINYVVHSANPIGRDNIIYLLNNFNRIYERE